MNIDYGDLLKKTYQIIIRHKFLWLFGFITALTSGGTGNFNTFNNISDKSNQNLPKIFTNLFSKMPALGIGVILALLLFGLISIVITAIFKYVSIGALIGQVDDIENNKKVSIKNGFSEGWHYFLSLFAIDLLIYFPLFLFILIILAILIGPGVLLLFAKKYIAGVIILILGGLSALVIIIALVVFSVFLQMISFRYKVIRDLGILSSLEEAFGLIKSNFGTVFVSWLIAAAISIVSGIAVMVPMVILSIPAFFIMAVSLLAGILLLIPIFLLLSFAFGIVKTYISTFWTLVFMSLTSINKTNQVL